VLPTNSTAVGDHVLVVNLQDDPATTVWGPQLADLGALEQNGTKVVYMGLRDNLGALPAIDSYFTDQTVVLPNGHTAQVLNPTPTSEVLEQTDGKVWALRDGNLWIITDSDWHTQTAISYLDTLDF